MKKLILMLSAVALFGSISANAQETVAKAKKEVKKAKKVKETVAATPKVQGPGMVFETETIDYGKIAHNSEPNRQFVLVNNGTEDLVITNTQGSCGCTVPTKPEKPIKPGEKGIIGVRYATDRVGSFTKTVTVSSNSKEFPNKVLTIKGEVLPAATPANPMEKAPVAPATNAPATNPTH
ncbi:MAG: DUF1573 domain-containing protein [Limnohabitans sp.]|nr:DUF1573 domain-containing protein [Limnohabitans sp.]